MGLRNLVNKDKFNLIISANNKYWEGDGELTRTFEKDRFLEHTDTNLRDKYSELDENVINELVNYPCLFLYEGQNQKYGYVGQITHIKLLGEIIQITFVKLYTVNNISRLTDKLDLDNTYELNRTHWAVKNINLLRLLANNDQFLNEKIFGIKIFLSWSKDYSKELAEKFKVILCKSLGLNDSEIFISSRSIDVGDDWWREVSNALSKAQVGIIFVTADNYKEPWLNYEAGILQNKLMTDNKNSIALPVSTKSDFKKIDTRCPLCKMQFKNNIENSKETSDLLKKISELLELDKKDINLVLENNQYWTDFINLVLNHN